MRSQYSWLVLRQETALELTLPVTIGLDYATRNLEKTVWTEPIHDLFCPASRTPDLMAVITVQQMLVGV